MEGLVLQRTKALERAARFAAGLGQAATGNGVTFGSGATNVSGTLNATTTGGGAIAQTGALGVGGTSSLNAGSGAITLGNTGNNFGDAVTVNGGHVPQPTLLADVLEVIDARGFRLLGRSGDLVNIAGKRSSIAHLNFHLNAIEGVVDGSFWMPPDDHDAAGVSRLVAFVVAPGVAAEQIRGALRQRIDAAFLPRRIVAVTALPREATGKLTAARLVELAAAHRV